MRCEIDDLTLYDLMENSICSNSGCTPSELVYQHLIDHGFKNTRRYAGGVADWEDAGYPLEGERVRRVESERKVL
jgi:hypothetical protein